MSLIETLKSILKRIRLKCKCKSLCLSDCEVSVGRKSTIRHNNNNNTNEEDNNTDEITTTSETTNTNNNNITVNNQISTPNTQHRQLPAIPIQNVYTTLE